MTDRGNTEGMYREANGIHGAASLIKADADVEQRNDGVAWRAARIILVRLINEPSYAQLDDGLRLTIERFLERHPAQPPATD
jgi:hypothetical protein